MNTGRLSILLWVLFLVGIFGVSAGLQEEGSGLAIGAGAVCAISFIYAMYLGLVAMRMGDPWLRRRGLEGTAEILSGKATSWAMAAGEYYGIGAPVVWKYRLRVSVSGRGTHDTSLYICAHLGESGTIPVRVSRWNRDRVTVDAEALAREGGPDRAPERARVIRAAVALGEEGR
jgi:hypothetical protein